MAEPGNETAGTFGNTEPGGGPEPCRGVCWAHRATSEAIMELRRAVFGNGDVANSLAYRLQRLEESHGEIRDELRGALRGARKLAAAALIALVPVAASGVAYFVTQTLTHVATAQTTAPRAGPAAPDSK